MLPRTVIGVAVAAGTAFFAVAPAQATFHLMKIEQVIGGVNGDVTAQAIQLRMRVGFQNFVGPARLMVRDANGLNPILVFDFTTTVTNGSAGDRILVASPSFLAQTTPAATADAMMTNLIPASYLAAGSLTFERDIGGGVLWRLSWGGGAYTGSNAGELTNDSDGNFGPPFPGPLPSTCARALQFQGSASAGSTTNADDYLVTSGAAVFINNARASFTVNTVPGVCCVDSECDDGVACTQDVCDAGVCTGIPIDALCNDGNPCTLGTCDATGCVQAPTTNPCDDGLACTTNDTCSGGVCGGGAPLDCDDGITCTADACAEPGGCVHTPDNAQCADDGLFCNGTEICSVTVGCRSSGSPCGAGEACNEETDVCQAPISISLATVAEGLTSPVFLTHAGDGSGRLFVLDQVGQIRIIDAGGTLLPTPFLDLTDRIVAPNPNFDERGVLGLAFHPDYPTNGRFFVRYSAPRAGSAGEPCFGTPRGCHKEVLAEFNVVGDPATSDTADPASEIVLFEIDEPQFNHDAGQALFGPGGLLYFTLGDGGGANDGLDDPSLPHGPIGNGQNIETTLGAMLRIDVDSPPAPGLAYAIPPGNPFVGVTGADEIYAYGFRNPYRFSFFDTGGLIPVHLIVGDVGQDLFEEIDVLPAVDAPGSLNHGWAVREGTHCFDPFNPGVPPAVCASTGPSGEPLIDPVLEYDHSVGVAVIGGFVYRGTGVPSLSGKYVFGDFSGRLFYADVVGLESPQLGPRNEFFLAPSGDPFNRALLGIGEDENGELYALANDTGTPTGSTGVVLKIVPPLPAVQGDNPRYLAVTLPPTPDPVGLVVTPGCAGGISQFVGPPSDAANIATLVDDATNAAFLDSAGWGGTVHITGLNVVPDTVYAVQLNSGSAISPVLSAPVRATTSIWGDTCGPFRDGAWSPPDGSVDVPFDVVCILDRFRGVPTAPPLYQVDLIGPSLSGDACTPDQGIDIFDVLGALGAFQGLDFERSTRCLAVCP